MKFGGLRRDFGGANRRNFAGSFAARRHFAAIFGVTMLAGALVPAHADMNATTLGMSAVMKRDIAGAKAIFAKSCEDDATACIMLATIALDSANDNARASELFDNAATLASPKCAAGDERACAVEKDALRFKNSLPSDAMPRLEDDKAIEEAQKSCDGGNLSECNRAGWALAWRDEYQKARELFAKSCDADDATGCYFAGSMVATFLPSAPDMDEVKALWQKSCKLGFEKACEFANIGSGGAAGHAHP